MPETKVAFVTGASRGIGKAIALTLAELGYQLSLVARDKMRLEEMAQELPAEVEPLLFPLNVQDEKALRASIDKTYNHFGRLDILVNGAGILIPGNTELSTPDFLSMMEINLFGAFYSMQAVIPYMQKQRSGYIFNIASRAGKVGVGPFAGYCTSKFGLVGMSEAFGNTLASYGIKVTAICPGWVDTDMAANSTVASQDRIPVEDIAATIRYLLSLSPNTWIKECLIECRKNIELAQVPLLNAPNGDK